MCFFRAIYRTICLIGMLMVFTVIAVVLHLLFSKNEKKRQQYLAAGTHCWARCFCFFLNIHFQVVGEFEPSPNALIVSNHIGSTDIYVLGSCFKAFFVSKAEVSQWPLVGWLSRFGGAIFVDRSRRHQVVSTISDIRNRLENGCSVITFPEGRATDGADVIPFKSSHFQAAVLAKRPVLPVMIRYLDPNTPSIACWYNRDFFSHMLALLKNAKLEVKVYILPEISGVEDRRILANESRRLIREAYQKK